MTGQRLALVLAADHYDDAGLRDLAPSGVDARALVDVLSSPGLGGFTVEYVRDPDSQNAFVRIHDLLAERDRSDVVLLYIIGQGLTGHDGQLYLAASDTDPDRLADTAIGSAWIARVMARSRADHVVMVLDCQWRLSDGTAELSDHFQPDEVDDGQSRAVLCRRPSAGPRDLARAIVAGLRTGEADRDGNGYVTVDELYDYIRDSSSAQGWETGSPGQPYVSRSPARRGGDVTDRLGDPRAAIRLTAVRQLGLTAAGADLDRAADARHSLGRAAEDPDETVALAALDELDRTAVRLAAGVVDFGTVSPVTPRLAEDVHIDGPPLARASTVSVSGRGLRAWISGSLLHVAWTPTGERLDGTVILSGPAGDAKLQVVGEIRAGVPAAAGAPARRRALEDLGALRDTTMRVGPAPAPPRPTMPLGGGGRPVDRRRLGLIFAGVLVLLVLLGVGIRALVDRGDEPAAGGRADTRIGAAPSRPGPAQIPPSVDQPTVAGLWKTGKQPEGVAVSPDSRTVFVADQDSKVLRMVDAATGQARTVQLPTEPHFVTVSNDGKRVYASLYGNLEQNSGVAVVDTDTGRVERITPTGPKPYDIGVAPDGRIWVPIHSAQRVEVYSADGTRKDATVQTVKNPHSVGFSPDGTFAYTPNHESNKVTMIVARTYTVAKTIKVATAPHNLAVSPDGGYILVAEYGADTAEILDTTNLSSVFRTAVGQGPQCAAFAADGRHGYIVNNESNTVSVINISTGKVTATIPVGKSPRTVATSPDGKFAYVTNGDDNTVTVLKVS
jgi:YVTN family beta-propeller protein